MLQTAECITLSLWRKLFLPAYMQDSSDKHSDLMTTVIHGNVKSLFPCCAPSTSSETGTACVWYLLHCVNFTSCITLSHKQAPEVHQPLSSFTLSNNICVCDKYFLVPRMSEHVKLPLILICITMRCNEM